MKLTKRQNETLQLLARGQKIDEIAGELGLGVQTVKNHLAAIYRKTGTHGKLEAVLWYQKSAGRSDGKKEIYCPHCGRRFWIE